MMGKITVCCLFILTAIACNKKVYEKEAPTYGNTSTEINGVIWAQNIKGVNFDDYGRFAFSAFKYKELDGVNIVFEVLEIKSILKNKNVQRIKAFVSGQQITNPDSLYLGATFSTTQDDGDLSCDMFHIMEADSVNNWIKITKEEGNYNEVWGEYSATFLRESGCASSPYPDTLRMRNGSFHFKFK